MFTEEERKAYENSSDFYKKSFVTAGVRSSFVTDADTMEFDYKMSYGTSGDYGLFDVY